MKFQSIFICSGFGSSQPLHAWSEASRFALRCSDEAQKNSRRELKWSFVASVNMSVFGLAKRGALLQLRGHLSSVTPRTSTDSLKTSQESVLPRPLKCILWALYLVDVGDKSRELLLRNKWTGRKLKEVRGRQQSSVRRWLKHQVKIVLHAFETVKKMILFIWARLKAKT